MTVRSALPIDPTPASASPPPSRVVAPRPAVPRVFNADDAGVVVCICPGPSLTYADLRHVYDLPPHVKTITVNDAYRPFPHAQFRFAADGVWWAKRTDAYDPSKYGGACYTLEYGGPPIVQKLDYTAALALSDDPRMLATGGHSGYAAINFAYLLGATTIVLLGYDMQPDGNPASPTYGLHHYGGDEPGQRHPRYHLWINRYGPLCQLLARAGVSLINCTRHTAIPAADVPRQRLDDIL